MTRESPVLSANNQGVTHERQGQLQQAAASYARAIELKSDWPDPHANLGNIFRKLGRYAEAEPHLRRALTLNPEHAKAHNFLGIVLYQTDRLAEAAQEFRRALELRENDFEAWNNLGMVQTRLGDAPAAIAAFRRSLALKPNPYGHSALLFTLHYDPALSPQAIFEEHLAWARIHAEPLKAQIRPHGNDRNPERRLRIGYVSADFREHTRARFVEPVIANHDRDQFEIFCYSDVRAPDAITHSFQVMADTWRQVAGWPDEKLAAQIRADQIDILIDLTGHMAGNRLLTFAQKPAPIQMTYPGYPNTTGLSIMDYCITDADRDPPGSESLYTEKLIRLDPTSQCYQPTDADLEVGPPPLAQAGYVTFASLNKPIKNCPIVVATWSRILKAVPDSKLMLLVNSGGAESLHDRFAAHGIPPERLELLARLPRRQYLELHRRIDINLDPWPYNGHTTLLDGLWMGVPAIALEGNAHVSREGAAALRLVGLPELVARSSGECVTLASSLAAETSRLRELRGNLRERLKACPLMDALHLTRRLEGAYREAWRQWNSRA
jgi:protein O-GlcNAc transferase